MTRTRQILLAFGATFLALVMAWLATLVCVPSSAAGDDASSVIATSSGKTLSASTVAIDANADASIRVSEEADAAVLGTASFGIDDFVRQNKGTNRSTDGTYYGYQYTMASQDAFAAVHAQGVSLIYIPELISTPKR